MAHMTMFENDAVFHHVCACSLRTQLSKIQTFSNISLIWMTDLRCFSCTFSKNQVL